MITLASIILILVFAGELIVDIFGWWILALAAIDVTFIAILFKKIVSFIGSKRG